MLFTIKDKNGTHQHLPSTYICDKCGDENTRLYVPEADLFVCSSGCGGTEFKGKPNYPADRTMWIMCDLCGKEAHLPQKVLKAIGWSWGRFGAFCPKDTREI